MKSSKFLYPFVFFFTFSSCSSAQFGGIIRDATKTIEKTVANDKSGSGFTEKEAGQAIKEALTKGIKAGVEKVSVVDGYFKNPNIKIPFPESVRKVETTLRDMGMGNMIDDVVLSLNRAAEDAAKQATQIFINAITQMTVSDAIGIVNNKQQDAATRFLERTTSEQLAAAFKPSIKTALDKVNATKYWSNVMTTYNKIPFVTKVEADLPEYVTRKAISGLFYMISLEEAKIRKDPMARTSEILKKVFGNVKI